MLSRVATLLAEQHPNGSGAAASSRSAPTRNATRRSRASSARRTPPPRAAGRAAAAGGDDSDDDDDDVGEAVPPLATPDEPPRRPLKEAEPRVAGRDAEPGGRGYSSLLAVCGDTASRVVRTGTPPPAAWWSAPR